MEQHRLPYQLQAELQNYLLNINIEINHALCFE